MDLPMLSKNEKYAYHAQKNFKLFWMRHNPELNDFW